MRLLRWLFYIWLAPYLFVPLILLTPVPGSAQVQEFNPSPQDVVKVNAKIGYSMLILVLPESNKILDSYSGDKYYWPIKCAYNMCDVHPAPKAVDTNYNLFTSEGKVVTVMLHLLDEKSAQVPDVKVIVDLRPREAANHESENHAAVSSSLGPAEAADEIKFVSADELRAQKLSYAASLRVAQEEISKAREEARTAVAKAGRDFNFRYRWNRKKGRKSPFNVEEIYDNHLWTFVKSEASEKPVLYERKDGKPNLIQFSLELEHYYVVPKIIEDGYVQVGKKKLDFKLEKSKS